jgi:uncharacterized protein (TIGR03000 family)
MEVTKAVNRSMSLALVCAVPLLLFSTQTARTQTTYGPYADPAPAQPQPQYFYQRYFRTAGPAFPFVSSIDAPNVYGAYTEGPGFFYSNAMPPADAPEEQVAYLHIRVVPAHAAISIEGSKTASIGSSRLYVSPPLNQGENFTYTIHVSWKENGKEVTQDRKVPVRAGDRLSIVFREQQPPATTSTLQTKPGS